MGLPLREERVGKARRAQTSPKTFYWPLCNSILTLPTPTSLAPPRPLIYKPYVPVSLPAPVCPRLQLLPLITRGPEVLGNWEEPRASRVQRCSAGPLPPFRKFRGPPWTFQGLMSITCSKIGSCPPFKNLISVVAPQEQFQTAWPKPSTSLRTFKPRMGRSLARTHTARHYFTTLPFHPDSTEKGKELGPGAWP